LDPETGNSFLFVRRRPQRAAADVAIATAVAAATAAVAAAADASAYSQFDD